jgi:uncharacterized membrane protein (UPF0127 family)
MLCFAGCDSGKPATPAGPAPAAKPAPKTVADWFPIKVGAETVRMQLAVTGPEMERGLMQRRDLGPDQGMIFIYARPAKMSFWMKNTPTPLDIGYFTADGVLREVWPMYPLDETPVPSRSDAIQLCLEMNQGWFKAHDVKPGAQLDLAAVAAGLRERGFDPAKIGLK